MKVPFVDLKVQYNSIKSDMDKAIQAVIDETAFVRGKYVQQFESMYAESFGVNNCVSCGNGTDAIYITLKSLGIGESDEVITVANSWISTSETITQAGARVVFVDIEPDYYNIDVDQIEAKITPRTKAILPVHLFGQPADIVRIQEICKANDLYLIEDCAQAHFSEYTSTDDSGKSVNQRVGTFGDVGTFSFYPGKNLGAYGDAGAIITDNDDLAMKCAMFANHGAAKKHFHDIEGINSRMDGIQAAVLGVKLGHMQSWTRQRQENARLYDELLGNIDAVTIPQIRANATHVYHLYVIRTLQRDKLQNFLKQRDIGTAVHYPMALPFMNAYSYLGHGPEDFPVAHQYQGEILSLPMFPELSEEQIRYVAASIEEFTSKL